MTDKLASIIIPTHNREGDVLKCLKSVHHISYPNFEVIVIDNASSDNTVAKIREMFNKVKIIEMQKNFGVAVGRNEGLRHAKGDYVCFLDSDNIVDKDFLTELINLVKTDKKIGFVGPKMCYFGDQKLIWYAGADINLWTSKTTYRGLGEIDNGQYDKVSEVGHIPNVWVVKREVIEKIGFMDTSYTMHYEEADWAIRAKEAGYKVVFCPSAVVYHNTPLADKGSGLRGLIGLDNSYRIFFAARNRTLFMKRFTGRFRYLVFILIFNNLFLVGYCLILFYYGRWDLIKSYVRGYLAGLTA